MSLQALCPPVPRGPGRFQEENGTESTGRNAIGSPEGQEQGKKPQECRQCSLFTSGPTSLCGQLKAICRAEAVSWVVLERSALDVQTSNPDSSFCPISTAASSFWYLFMVLIFHPCSLALQEVAARLGGSSEKEEEARLSRDRTLTVRA